MVDRLFEELAGLYQVEAIALGGSRSGNNYDEKSDYDVYVYIKEDVSEDVRRDILSKYCSNMEIGNHYWEYEDNCTLNNGIDIDILWRRLDTFLQGISEVVDDGVAANGYTTCMWHNLTTCKILYDKEMRLNEAQKKYIRKYPLYLKNNIIERNMNLLSGRLPSYDSQIKKAVKRNDRVSINHRVTEFLASYFDIIFALNELTHPGEKRLVRLCMENCRILPRDFKENLDMLFNHMATDINRVPEDVNNIVDAIKVILEE